MAGRDLRRRKPALPNGSPDSRNRAYKVRKRRRSFGSRLFSGLTWHHTLMLRSLFRTCALRAADLTAILAIILLAFFYTANLHRLADLSMYDETNDMDLGRHLATRPIAQAAYSPFYVIWYALLSKLRPDAIDLFFSNTRLLIILLPLALYAALRSLSVQPLLAMFTTTLLIYGPEYEPVYPKCSHLAAISLLLTLAAIFIVRSVYQKASICSAGLLIASYLRPEFFTAYLLAAAIFVALSIWKIVRYRTILPVVKAIAAPACASAICFLFFGVPWPGDSRSFMAFGQHFSENWVAWNHTSLDPWTAWESIVQTQFGDVHSFLEAVMAKPTLVAQHVLSNVMNGLSQTSRFYSWFPANGISRLARWQWLIYWLIFLVGMAVWRNRKLQIDAAALGRKLVERFVWIAICFFPPVISCVLIYPREHYLLFLALAAPLAAAALMSEKSSINVWREVVWIVALAYCGFIFTRHCRRGLGRATVALSFSAFKHSANCALRAKCTCWKAKAI
jgi:hypothetical protein